MDKQIIVFDLDGTLADIRHRKHHLEGETDWEQFFEQCNEDQPIVSVCTLFDLLNETRYPVHIWTGRNETVKDKTEDWLDKYEIDYDELRMRPKEDYRPDYEIKEEWAKEVGKNNIRIVIEDREQVIEMWENLEVPVICINQVF